jgi:PTS system ascorbate-specific IIC component
MNMILGFLEQFLQQGSLMVGLMAFIGLAIQKKPVSDIIKGTVKTIVGFLLIGAGAGVVIGGLTPLNDLLAAAFNVTGIVPINEVMFAVSVTQYGTQMAAILAIGWILNLFLARFSNFKNIYLTGHEAMWISTVMAIALNWAGLPYWQVVVGGGMFVGLYMTVAPSMIQKSVAKVIGNNDVGVAHTGTVFYWVAAAIAKVVGNKEKSAEDLNIPKSLTFLRDLTVSLSLAMLIVYFVVCLVVNIAMPEVIKEVYGESNWFISIIISSMNFAAGVYVIQAGVRMVLADLLPAFKGIADKLIPDARACLDIPVLYPYQPNSVLLGFLVSTVAGLVAFFIQLALVGSGVDLPVIIPTLFTSFFFGATFGALCNKEGGVRGVVIGSFVAMIIAQFIPSFLISIGNVMMENTTFGGGDTGVVGIFFGLLSRYINGQVIFGVIIVLFLLPLITARFRKPSQTI